MPTPAPTSQPPNLVQRLNNYLVRRGFYDVMKQPRFLYGVAGFLVVYVASGYFAALVCNAMGFLFPAYKSIKAIESPEKDDDTMWLMYWVVFAAFSVVEFFSDIFLSWFPFYFLAKCGFLVWCMAPVTWNGSSFIYMKFLRPLVLRNQGELDRALERAQKGAQNMAKGAMKEARQAAATVAAEVVTGSLKKDD